MVHRTSVAAFVVTIVSSIIGGASATAAPGDCAETPDPERWTSAGAPDQGSSPVISAHRGASRMAPENTLWAYRHAFAYGVDMVEFDVRETADGHYISMHDDTLDRTTNGEGPVAALTLEEIRDLNAADYAPWAGGEYDPSIVPTVEEVAAMAARRRRGHRVRHQGRVRSVEAGSDRRSLRDPRALGVQLAGSEDPGRVPRGPAHLQPGHFRAARLPLRARQFRIHVLRFAPRRVHRRKHRRDPRCVRPRNPACLRRHARRRSCGSHLRSLHRSRRRAGEQSRHSRRARSKSRCRRH